MALPSGLGWAMDEGSDPGAFVVLAAAFRAGRFKVHAVSASPKNPAAIVPAAWARL